jgi:orotate phosphoribosyltransferase
MDRRKLAAAIHQASHLTGEFRLRSGAVSNHYFDKYRFESNPKLLRMIVEALVRKAPKSYGTCRLAEGGDIVGRRLLVVEDVVTSGGQVLESAQALRALGGEVLDALCVIDRESGGTALLGAEGIKLHALFRMSELDEAAA